MIKSNVTTGRESLRSMLDGMKVASNAIRATYGPQGGNGAVEIDLYPYHIIANDAQSLVQAMWVEDPIANMGLEFEKELCNKAELDSGDGRKTTIILGEEIMERGYESGIEVMLLKKELLGLYPVIEEDIAAQIRFINENEVEGVAAVASESAEIGKIIGDIYKVIGKEGRIDTEYVLGQKGHTFTTTEGVVFQNTGYLSEAMVYDEEARKDGRKEIRTVYENPTILVTKKKFATMKEVGGILNRLKIESEKTNSLIKNPRDLVIFTSDMESNVAQVLINTHKSPEAFNNILIIKAPVIFQQTSFDDFAKCVGATVVEDATGVNFVNLQLKHFGTCGKIVVDKNETILLGTLDMSEHIAELKAKGDNDSLLRASWLTTKTALLKIGADTETALSYLRLKASDAVNSARLALLGGVVQGGGYCLYQASQSLPDTITGNLMREVLKSPMRQIKANMGLQDEEPFLENVIDSALVVKNAIKNALSLASTILTTKLTITKPPKTPEQLAHDMLMKTGARPF